MEPRIDYRNIVSKEALHALYGLEQAVRKSGLETGLPELARMRASQIDGCASCLDMHSKDARAEGETEQRLYGLSAWREIPYYSDREPAALECAEAITLLANLTPAVAIDSWNRIAISFRAVPGSYERPKQAAS